MNILDRISKLIYSVEYTSTSYRSHSIHKIVRILGIKFKFKTSNNKLINCKKRKKISNCLAVISPDGIGDYMFIRQFFKYIKESPKYKDKYLCIYLYALLFYSI